MQSPLCRICVASRLLSSYNKIIRNDISGNDKEFLSFISKTKGKRVAT